MSRRCHCSRVLELVQTDPRLLVLPLAVRGLFVALAGIGARMEAPGVFRIGGKPLGFDQVSVLVSSRETEIETWVETLVETGLMACDAADGALLMPLLVQGAEAADAAERSRKNGQLGGRPRRGETAAQARDRRQGALLMGIEGGAAEKPEKTQPETLASARGSQPASASEVSLSQASQEAAGAVDDATLMSIGAELAELAGFDPARDGYALTDVRAWLVAGATRELLVDVIGGIARRPSYRKPDRYFRYFNGAVTEAIRDRRSQPARAIATVAPADPERAAAIAAYNRAFTEWQNNGCMGPGPRLETGRAAA